MGLVAYFQQEISVFQHRISIKHLAVPDGDTVKTVIRHQTWRDIETRDRAKTRHTSVETESRQRHEKPCLETVSTQDTCVETPWLSRTCSLTLMWSSSARASHIHSIGYCQRALYKSCSNN